MFEYYSADDDHMPMTFILIGSFISTPFPVNGYSTTYKSHWDALANVLSHFPQLTANCSFVFVPGPNDPWTTSPGCLPRRGIPEAFTNRVRRICKDVRFVSNPTRLGYFTQEICVFRSDIADALIRNRIMVKDGPSRQDPTLDEATLAARDVLSTPPVLSRPALTVAARQNNPRSIPSNAIPITNSPNILVLGSHHEIIPPSNRPDNLRYLRMGALQSNLRRLLCNQHWRNVTRRQGRRSGSVHGSMVGVGLRSPRRNRNCGWDDGKS